MKLLYLSTEPNDPISAYIREKTNCAWSHVGFYDTETRLTLSAKCDGHGVAYRSLKPTEEVIYFTVPGIDAAYAKMQTLIGEGYDLVDILGMMVGRNWSTQGKTICDVSVFQCFEDTGSPLLNPKYIPRVHLTPRDILLCKDLVQTDALGVPLP